MYVHRGCFCKWGVQTRCAMDHNDTKRVMIRLPEETWNRLHGELDSFNTQTAMFQYLVQFYFDWKEIQDQTLAEQACDDGEQPGSESGSTSPCS